jgi:hypothetical protein
MTDLSPTDVRIVAAALAHSTQEEAARAAGVSLRTYQRRLATEPVRDALSEAATAQLRDVTVALSRHASKAVEVLGQMTDGTLAPQSARVKAAAAVVTLAMKVRELDVAERLATALERPSAPDGFGGSA